MKKYRILMAMVVLAVLIVTCAADDSAESFQAAGKLYSDSVDLANAGNYQEALNAADKALAMNVSSLTGIIQSNRAGILVMQHRYDDAITAADAALAVEGNLTAAHSIAWYNRGNALRALGRIPEATSAYEKAYALDNTLVPPDMSADVTMVPVSPSHAVPASPTPRSPLSAGLVLAALGGLACMGPVLGKK